MAKSRPVFLSGNSLPQNLYHTNKPKFLNEKFRYKKPNGKFQTITGDEITVTKFANEANDYFAENGSLMESDNNKKPVVKNSVGHAIELFIAHRNDEYPSSANATKWKQSQQGVRKIMRTNLDDFVEVVTTKFLRSLWRAMSYSQQKNYRAFLKRFVMFLKAEELVPESVQNVFISSESGGLEYKETVEKKRGILTKKVFVKMRSIARSKEYFFLEDMMNIGMSTYFREGDILSMRFDDIKDGELLTQIAKSKSRTKSQQVIHGNVLAVQKFLKEYIKKSKSRLGSGSDCPYVIHHNYARKVTSKNKDHQMQVLRRYVSDCWTECLSEIKGFKKSESDTWPTFHEIRALRNHLEPDNRSSKEISLDMGHADEKVTNSYYLTHGQKYHPMTSVFDMDTFLELEGE